MQGGERRWTVTNSLGIVQSDRKRDPEIPQSNTALPIRSLKVLVVQQTKYTSWKQTYRNIIEFINNCKVILLDYFAPIHLTQVSYRSY